MYGTKLICIVGPTAVGKTNLSIAVARSFQGEIISADSRQVYRGLDIGSGKVTAEEMEGVPHHLLDVADPKGEAYTAADFVRDGTKAVRSILERRHVPVIAGGTGFYIDALLSRRALADVAPNEALRKKLEEWSLERLQEALRRRDPARYETIDTRNPRRLIRALEIAEALGKNPLPTMINHSAYTVLWIGLTLPMEKLREKIHARLLARMEIGMLNEAKQLHHDGLSYERMDALGLEYRAMARHLRGTISYETMLEEIEKESVAYAKRQMTWFKQNKDIHWFTPNQEKEILELVETFLK